MLATLVGDSTMTRRTTASARLRPTCCSLRHVFLHLVPARSGREPGTLYGPLYPSSAPTMRRLRPFLSGSVAQGTDRQRSGSRGHQPVHGQVTDALDELDGQRVRRRPRAARPRSRPASAASGRRRRRRAPRRRPCPGRRPAAARAAGAGRSRRGRPPPARRRSPPPRPGRGVQAVSRTSSAVRPRQASTTSSSWAKAGATGCSTAYGHDSSVRRAGPGAAGRRASSQPIPTPSMPRPSR